MEGGDRIDAPSAAGESIRVAPASRVAIVISSTGVGGGLDGIATVDPPDRHVEWTLDFAGPRGEAIAHELGAAAYQFDEVTALHDLDGTSLKRVLDEVSTRRSGVVVVHYVGHARIHSGHLYLPGSDAIGQVALPNSASITHVLDRIDDDPHGPIVLVLLDACHAGAAVDHQRIAAWRPVGERRAWLVAGAAADELAHSGLFSTAVATILRRLSDHQFDLDPSDPYVSLDVFAREVQTELVSLTGDEWPAQSVRITPRDSPELPRLQFFPNPGFDAQELARMTSLRAKLPEQALQELITALDSGLDARHFLSRGSARPDDALGADGLFSGRVPELSQIRAWLDRAATSEPSLTVITGGPGAGKSALLGVVVAAVHPDLPRDDYGILRHLNPDNLPAPVKHFAGVHARRRDRFEIVSSIARQLGLPPVQSEDGAEQWLMTQIWVRFTKPEDIPLIVIDAVDEADDPQDIVAHLIEPLAGERRSREHGAPRIPICRVIVGTRPWTETENLRRLASRSGALIDLSTVSRERLREEVAEYVARSLIAVPGFKIYGDARIRSVGRAIADRLTAVRGSYFTGAFLVASLVCRSAAARQIELSANAADPQSTPESLVDRVPRSWAELVEFELADLPTHEAEIAVLWALAFARGDGIPRSLLTGIARELAAPPVTTGITPAAVAQALSQMSFYLRISRDADGFLLYRFFHQALADHFVGQAASAYDGDHQALQSAVLDGLMVGLESRGRPKHYERRRSYAWYRAPLYLLRHGGGHAQDANRLDELLSDYEFLLACDAESTAGVLTEARSLDARMNAAIFETSLNIHIRASSVVRRQVFAVDATRLGYPDLANRVIGDAPDLGGVSALDVVWATAKARRKQTRGAGGADSMRPRAISDIWALAFGQWRGHPVVVAGATGGLVTGISHLSGDQLFQLTAHAGAVSGLATSDNGSVRVLVSAGHDRQLHVWNTEDLPEKGPVATRVLHSTVTALSSYNDRGRPCFATYQLGGPLRFWEVDPLRTRYFWEFSDQHLTCLETFEFEGEMAAAAGTEDGRVYVVCATYDEAISVTREPLPSGVRALTVLNRPGGHVIVCGLEDGSVVSLTRERRMYMHRVMRRGSADVTITALVATVLDGRGVVLSGDSSGTVRMLDVALGTESAYVNLPDSVHGLSIAGTDVAVAFGGDVALIRPRARRG